MTEESTDEYSSYTLTYFSHIYGTHVAPPRCCPQSLHFPSEHTTFKPSCHLCSQRQPATSALNNDQTPLFSPIIKHLISSTTSHLCSQQPPKTSVLFNSKPPLFSTTASNLRSQKQQQQQQNYSLCRGVGMGSRGKQVWSMDEEPQVRGCYNITFICTPTNQETV